MNTLGKRRRYRCGCVAEYRHVDYEWRGPIWAVVQPCAKHGGQEVES